MAESNEKNGKSGVGKFFLGAAIGAAIGAIAGKFISAKTDGADDEGRCEHAGCKCDEHKCCEKPAKKPAEKPAEKKVAEKTESKKVAEK